MKVAASTSLNANFFRHFIGYLNANNFSQIILHEGKRKFANELKIRNIPEVIIIPEVDLRGKNMNSEELINEAKKLSIIINFVIHHQNRISAEAKFKIRISRFE